MRKKNNRNLLLIVVFIICIVVLYVAMRKTDKTKDMYDNSLSAQTAVLNGPHDINSAKDVPIPVDIPEGIGHLSEGYTAPGGNARVVIHIQDIHTNYEAQKNLSKMLEIMIKDNGLRLVMVEGGWGNVSLSYLRSYAGSERRQEVAEEYLREGKISGEEYLDIVADYDIQLEGVEDESLYKTNLDVFFEIEKFRQQASAELAALERIIDRLKKKIYSPQIIELEKIRQDYDNENVTLADYYRYLEMSAAKTGQDISGYPYFSRFMAVVRSESSINFTSVEKERAALIETLSRNLSKQELAGLVAKSLEFRLNKLTPVQYHDYLFNTARQAGRSTRGYANLERYMEYIRMHNMIDTAKLFDEADELLCAVENAMIKGPSQKRLYVISKNARILDNFLQLKLIPNDFKYYKQDPGSFLTSGWVEFLQQQAQHGKISTNIIKPAITLDKHLSTLVRFYDLANQRDDIFVQNVLRLMDEGNVNIAVLIAGGFHTPNLKQKFKECGLSYIVAAPHTTQQTDPERYRYILKYKSGKEE
jgi:hypothetical protein